MASRVARNNGGSAVDKKTDPLSEKMILSGHGSFGQYTRRIGKTASNLCRYCGEVDTPEHTLTACPRWEGERHLVCQETGHEVLAQNFMEIVEHSWNKMRGFINKIMEEKIIDELEEQGR
ncbi:uncharacterized protein [Leptinotarsa decemlineata]|uniref:uncharacterized protein n=1 Tax=Leptinotarsa decemlineata TaxID=7539 RepID=UPI003D309561